MALGLLLLAVLAQGLLGSLLVRPAYVRDYMPKGGKVTAIEGLSPELLFLQFFGFREFLAGVLWVRADSFFENGNYDAILPLIRIITWLDPHFIDVYSTGMWHVGYNFADEDSRSDRRYVPFALALGKEGAANNPNTYELYFETGWIWYHKIDDDYENAVKWFRQAVSKPDISQSPARRHLLANALIRTGAIEKGLEWYMGLLAEAQAEFNKDPTYRPRITRDTIENNVDTTLIRMAQRGFFARKRADGSYEQSPYDTRPPFDVGFSARVTVEEAGIIRVEGTWGVQPVGTRIRMILRDQDYPRVKPAGQDWDYANDVSLEVPKKNTYMQDGLFVKNRRFRREIDLSKDPTMYPMTTKDYVVEFYYNPRSAPPHLQDKFGYDGEGMTDKNFLNVDIRPGQRVIYAQLHLTRDQLKRRGRWANETPVVQTPNFVPFTASADEGDVIAVPGLRAGGNE
jgi:hypothetical protein